VSVDKNQLLNTMNQIVVLNATDANARRPQPTAASRRKPATDSMGSCSPPPTYSQVFKATEVALTSDLNGYENGPIASGGGGGAQTPVERQQTISLSPSHEKTKNNNSLLVINDHNTESTNHLSHSSSLSSSPVSCMTSTSSSSSPIIAAALLKSQSSIIHLSQPSRHMTETKYCFNGNGIHRNPTKATSSVMSSVETSEEDYDTDIDAETIAANDMFCNMKCNNSNQNQLKTPKPMTGYTNPLINGKINDQNASKYALITRLDHQNAFPPTSSHSFNYDTNSSWC
jgi:hypothetical protein